MTAADEASPDGDLGAVGLDAEPGDGRADVPPLVVRGPGGTVTLSPGPVYLIGRDPDADVVVDAPMVSWQHAQLLVTAGQWLIQDAGSTNGTFSGGLRVRRMRITGTVEFRLGNPEDGPLLVLLGPRRRPAAPAGAARPRPPTRPPRCGPAIRRGTGSQRGSPGSSTGRCASAGPTTTTWSSGTCRYLAATPNYAASAAAAFSSPTPAAATAPSSTASGSPPQVVTEADVIGIGAATFRLAGDELREFDAADGVLLTRAG